MIKHKGNLKVFASPDYNYIFNRKTGEFAAWGKTPDEDPVFCSAGPNIFDCEITTRCSGIPQKSLSINGRDSISTAPRPCSFCYKANTAKGENMSLETFKMIFDCLPETICQIAFGADATLTSNPDLWAMMDYCLEHKVVPNITCANVSEEVASKLAGRTGACAVSYYGNWDIFEKSVRNLLNAGQKNINCHVMISEETIPYVYDILEHGDSEIVRSLGAVVFLSLKTCGRGKQFHRVSQKIFTAIVAHFLQRKIPFGADSCSAHKMIQAFKDLSEPLSVECVLPCESSLESIYCSVDGTFYPCSFNEKEQFGVKCTKETNFAKDVWFSPQFENFRTMLLKNDRKCPCYNVQESRMIIRTKTKDFYDYVQYIYGQDPNIVWDRDVITRDSKKLFVSDSPLCKHSIFQTTIPLEKFGLPNYTVNAPGYISHFGFRCISILGKVYLTHKGLLVTQELFEKLHKENEFYCFTPIPFQGPWESIYEFTSKVDEEVFKIHKQLNAPIIQFTMHGAGSHGYVDVFNAVPIISEIPGFVKLLGRPEEFYQKIYNFFIENRENMDLEPPVSVDNKSKIQKAGFDLKSSFRHPIKQEKMFVCWQRCCVSYNL